MMRSFSNRLFGGVCGGLAQSSPFNAWIWRILFIVLTLATMGVGAVVYMIMWWLLPMESPLGQPTNTSLPGLISILLALILLGAWFGRDLLQLTGSYGYWAGLLVTLVFLCKQIMTRRWQNLSFALVAVGLAGLLVAHHYQMIPIGIWDMMQRAWAALLIFLGLALILRPRVPLGSWIALAISIALVLGLATFAYRSRVNVVSDANQITLAIPNQADHDFAAIGDDVTTLVLDLRTLDTDVTLAVSDDDQRVIGGQFVGSNNSNLVITYDENQSIATASISEEQRADFPRLDDLGRATLTLRIPPDIAFGLTFNGQHAQEVILDMGELKLESLYFQLDQGDVLVRLPAYQPQSPSVVESNGTWVLTEGSLNVVVPQTLGLRFSLARATNSEPDGFDDTAYQLLLEGQDYVLASRQFDDYDAQMRYRLLIGSGVFNLEN